MCFLVYTPLCYVRKIEKFSSFHIFADVVIAITVVVIIGYASDSLAVNGPGNDIVFINTSTFLDMIGFAVYSYEGVGIMLPVREITLHKEDYKKILFCVMTTVFSSYAFFGVLTYVAYGTNTQTIILSNLPFDTTFNQIFVSIVILLFCGNLLISYPLVIYPANIIIEN